MIMNMTLKTLMAAAVFSASVLAAPQTFDFKDAKGVNNVIFRTDAPLESINGTATGVSGMVTFDPANPAATKGKIVVTADSLNVPNSMMKGHLHGDQWLDVKKYPEITFELKELKNVKTNADVTSADAAGTFTLRGKSKEITVPVKLTYLKDKLSARMPNMKGDLLVIRGSFDIKRSDFGINPGAPADKVSDEINLTLAIAGASPK
jgi:polyisoprenoid-binding protein YceI